MGRVNLLVGLAVALFGVVLLLSSRSRPDPRRAPESSGNESRPRSIEHARAFGGAPPEPAPAEWPCRLLVRLVDPAGEPVSGATVVFVARTPVSVARGVTNDAGRITLDASGAGRLEVTAHGGLAPARRALPTPAPSGTMEVEVHLEPGETITGSLLDHEGDACRGRVRASLVSGPDLTEPPWQFEQQTDARGRFRLPDLPPGTYRIVAEPSLPADGGPSLPVLAGTGDDVTLRSTPPTVLRLLDETTGEPIEGPIEIDPVDDESGVLDGFSSVSNADGEVLLGEVVSEPHRVRIVAEGYEALEVFLDPMEAPGVERVIRLRPSGIGIGRVVLLAGRGSRPLDVARIAVLRREEGVLVRPFETYRADGGRIELSLPAGARELHVRIGSEFACRIVEVEEGKTITHDLDLSGGGNVRVVVQGIHHAWIRFETEQGHELHPEREDPDDGRGGWLYRGLPKGRITVVVVREGGPERREVWVGSGGTAEVVFAE